MGILARMQKRTFRLWVAIRDYFINRRYDYIDAARLPALDERLTQKGLIVSLTSYSARLKYAYKAISSIFLQTVLPERIILYLDESCMAEELPEQLYLLQQKGLEIEYRPYDIKPNKKYYFAMKENPSCTVVTVDDDCIYNKNLIKRLLKSSQKHPESVSAVRVHRMLFDENHHILPYNDWDWDVRGKQASKEYFVTGVAGALYPPGCMDCSRLLDHRAIEAYSSDNDDVWLKINQLMSGTDVVKVNCSIHTSICGSQESSLNSLNVHNSRNDAIIRNVCDYFNVDLYQLIYRNNHR